MCIACLKFGISVSISTPPGIEMDSDIVDEANKVAERNGATFELTHDSLKASTNANILVTDTFVSMGEEFAKQAKLKQFKGFKSIKNLSLWLIQTTNLCIVCQDIKKKLVMMSFMESIP